MNPFARMNIYTKDQMRQYCGANRNDLEPHLFAIAEEAYRKMINFKENQSIIVSGESGAGKTQSAKYVMRYFATVDELGTGRPSVGDQNTKIEEAVLSTNPIMESFGNAKTTRNDNSSRFGKYIEILFGAKNDGSSGVEIIGAKLRTYLLERSRLVFQAKNERNYHIFYQLCAAAPAAERAELELGTWDKFTYLNLGGTGVVAGMDDIVEFAATQKALSIVGVSVSVQWDIFRICAALLHIGNIVIIDQKGISNISDTDPALLTACKLLEIKSADFKKWIIKRQISTRSEKIITDSDVAFATVSRDSVSKYIYCLLFDWLVKIVNNKLEPIKQQKVPQFIGVLDIYGFEHFETNSFEQFCINYANEKLQQEFTRHVFKLEQEMYVAEGINWSFINFSDNGPCIDLIEAKMGILDLLDEETRLPGGADENLVTKLYNRFAPNGGAGGSTHFLKPRFAGKEFIVKHYALDVTYQIAGFLEKNKDTVSDEQLTVMNDTRFAFLKAFIAIPAEDASASNGPSRGPAKKPTLGTIFKASLVKLMETIRATNPHYIRCIKPNQSKVAFEFEPQNVLGQLIACGVLETIKISRAGYPSKQTYQEFVDRYYFLVKSSEWNKPVKELSGTIAKANVKGEGQFECGHTKIFFRAGQLAFLEKIRSETFTKIIIMIQKSARRFICLKRYAALKRGVLLAQCRWRGYICRKRVWEMRCTKSAIIIQSALRGMKARKQYRQMRRGVVQFQRMFRKHIRAKNAEYYKQYDAAVDIQRMWRGYKARKMCKNQIKRIIWIQSCLRRRICRLKFKLLKVMARSTDGLKQTNYKLEAKIVELSQKNSGRQGENQELLDKIKHLEGQVVMWKDRHVKLETDMKAMDEDEKGETADLRKRIQLLMEERDGLFKEQEKATAMVRKRDDQLAQLTQEVAHQKEEIGNMAAAKKSVVKDDQGTAALKKEVASLREQMSRMVAGKYATDQKTEHFLNNDTPKPEQSRNAMSFFESAAQVTAQVAGSFMGSGGNLTNGLKNNSSYLDLSDPNRREFSSPQEVTLNI
jgi:myosin-5